MSTPVTTRSTRSQWSTLVYRPVLVSTKTREGRFRTSQTGLENQPSVRGKTDSKTGLSPRTGTGVVTGLTGDLLHLPSPFLTDTPPVQCLPGTPGPDHGLRKTFWSRGRTNGGHCPTGGRRLVGPPLESLREGTGLDVSRTLGSKPGPRRGGDVHVSGSKEVVEEGSWAQVRRDVPLREQGRNKNSDVTWRASALGALGGHEKPEQGVDSVPSRPGRYYPGASPEQTPAESPVHMDPRFQGGHLGKPSCESWGLRYQDPAPSHRWRGNTPPGENGRQDPSCTVASLRLPTPLPRKNTCRDDPTPLLPPVPHTWGLTLVAHTTQESFWTRVRGSSRPSTSRLVRDPTRDTGSTLDTESIRNTDRVHT